MATHKGPAKAAGKQLASKSATQQAKKVAASDLAQAPKHNKKK